MAAAIIVLALAILGATLVLALAPSSTERACAKLYDGPNDERRVALCVLHKIPT